MSREQTRRRRAAVSAVHEIVSAMRAIAAGRIQGAQRALESARQYHAIVMRGIAALLNEWELPVLSALPSPPTALLIMTSEQPFCGTFNQNILALAESRWSELSREGRSQLLVVGQRGLRQLLARGLVPDHGEPAATSLAGIHDLVKRLAILVGRHYASGEIRSLRVIFNRYRSISEQIPTEVQVLPPDLTSVWKPGSETANRFRRYLSEPDLLSGLIDEYAFVSLYLLAVESYTSEQSSRLVAMDNSTRNTEAMLEVLIDRDRRERQDLITREVLDLIAARFTSESVVEGESKGAGRSMSRDVVCQGPVAPRLPVDRSGDDRKTGADSPRQTPP